MANLSKGTSGLIVRYLQFCLARNLKFISIAHLAEMVLQEADFFGPKTHTCVVEFQNAHENLIKTGEVDVATWKELGVKFLKMGDNDSTVKSLQTMLNKWNTSPLLKIDGIFGNKTYTAVANFQRMNKLTVDSVVGPQTWAILIFGDNSSALQNSSSSSRPSATPPITAPSSAPRQTTSSAIKTPQHEYKTLGDELLKKCSHTSGHLWMQFAIPEIGVEEFDEGNNPRVVEYLASVFLRGDKKAIIEKGIDCGKKYGYRYGDEIPWCGSFVRWVLLKAGYRHTQSECKYPIPWGYGGAAAYWLSAEYLDGSWAGSQEIQVSYGAIAVDHTTNKNDEVIGAQHVGFVLQKIDNEKFLLLSGNQSNKVWVSKEKFDEFLFFWPKDASLSTGSSGATATLPNVSQNTSSNLDYNINGLKVDYNFIGKMEGKSILNGYVPNPEGSMSGVTICTGVDLGQKNVQDLKNQGIPDPIITKLQPYLGRKKQDAVNFLKSHPLKLTQEEADKIDRGSHQYTLKRLERNYNAASKVPFNTLPSQAQTVITSVATQYGEDSLPKRTPKFWNCVINQNWVATVQELRNFGDAYSTRRNKEADLLETLIVSK